VQKLPHLGFWSDKTVMDGILDEEGLAHFRFRLDSKRGVKAEGGTVEVVDTLGAVECKQDNLNRSLLCMYILFRFDSKRVSRV
jgi:hypothetical protein